MAFQRLVGFACVLLSTIGTQAAPNIKIAEPNAWVDTNIMPELVGEASPDATTGFDVLLLDQQISVPASSRYIRTVYRVTSAEGVQRGSQVSVQFNPEFERLDFHHVRVMRRGANSDRLSLEKVHAIQQEKELERFEYNGEITALLLLDDVRVGDIVDVAYSIEGRNPIFGKDHSAAANLGWASPTRLRRIRILSDSNRPVYTKLHGSADAAVTEHRDRGQIELFWTAARQKPIKIDDLIPAGYSPVPFLQFTTYRDWRSVVHWALPLYELADPVAGPVASKTAELIKNAGDQEDKALAILQFVQEEIRYLAVQLGSHSHKPNAPEVVLERRYGDCKDKVMLLCAMLKAAGIRSVPALTHSSRRNRLREFLPDPGAFDHVIARIDIGQAHYFVDPTLTNQGGRLRYRALPEYAWALPIEEGAEQLVPVETGPEAKAGMYVEEKYEAKEWGGDITVQMRAVYFGRWADGTRAFCRTNSAEEREKYFLNRRARYYPNVRPTEPVRWETNERTNTVTVTTHYIISDMWQSVPGTTKKAAEFIPAVLLQQTVPPEAPNRSMPLALEYPMSMAHVATIKVPAMKRGNDSKYDVDTEYLRGSVTTKLFGDDVRIESTLMNKVSEVPAANVAEYAKKLREFRSRLGYTVAFDSAVLERNKQFRTNWVVVAVVGTTILACAYGGWRAYHWPIAAAPANDQGYAGLGGWLVLVGIGVALRPVLHLAATAKLLGPQLDARAWPMPETGLWLSPYGYVVCGEIGFNLFLTCMAIVMLAAFVGKRRVFPVLFVGYVACAVLGPLADSVAVHKLLDRPFVVPRDLWQVVMPALVWVPYMLVSKRVRATFVNGPEPKPAVSTLTLAASPRGTPPQL